MSHIAIALVLGLVVFAYVVGAAFERFCCDCLREDRACDCQPDGLRRGEQGAGVHGGING